MRVKCNFPLEWYEHKPRMALCQFLQSLFPELCRPESQYGSVWGGGGSFT